MYQHLIKPFLFLFTPEKAHAIASVFLKLSCIFPFNTIVSSLYKDKSSKSYSCMGIDFPSRLGLAAGFDKNATLYKGLFNLGFGFVEIGTVTPKAQPGNEKPRLFRLPPDNALINRMGFNNDGIEKAVNKLRFRDKGNIIGGNIG